MGGSLQGIDADPRAAHGNKILSHIISPMIIFRAKIVINSMIIWDHVLLLDGEREFWNSGM